MTTKKYILIGLLVGVIVAGLGTVAGANIAAWIRDVQTQAIYAGMGAIADFIANPLIWLMTNPLIGAVIVAIAWPFLLVWLVLLFVMIVFGFGADAARATRSHL